MRFRDAEIAGQELHRLGAHRAAAVGVDRELMARDLLFGERLGDQPLAERLVAETLAKQQIPRHQLTIHAHRGSAMRSKPVEFLPCDLGVTKTHSRPYTSTDNPYSEAQFKTLKYRPGFPARFDSLEQARAFCREFFDWYNHAHRHSGIGLMAPATVHHGQAEEAHAARGRVLGAAYQAAPERFVSGAPKPPT